MARRCYYTLLVMGGIIFFYCCGGEAELGKARGVARWIHNRGDCASLLDAWVYCTLFLCYCDNDIIQWLTFEGYLLAVSVSSDFQLVADLSDPALADDPYAFSKYAYSWGEGDLARFDGVREWQKEVLLDIRDYIKEAKRQKRVSGMLPDFYKMAIASGRGIGKSALLGIITHWFISTRIGGSVWIAANGEPQLRTKTFPEIAKWVMRGVNSHWFEINAMSIQPAKWFRELIERPLAEGGLGKSTKYYYASGQLWSAENPDAFAGAHNWDGELAIFDESAGIPAPIWTVQEGVFTEDIVDRYWLCFSNPRSTSGAFFEKFHKERGKWRTKQIDSRTVEGINHSSFNSIIEKYGEDSDEARVEVKGEFPRADNDSFIPFGDVESARNRDLETDDFAPLIMGFDIALSGEDTSVIRFRRGRDARSIPPLSAKKEDPMELACWAADAINKYKPDAVCIDMGNAGAGVVYKLRELGFKVHGVWFSASSDNSRYANKRAQMWGDMKDWLKQGCIDSSQTLLDDLTGPKREWDTKEDKVLLESKKKMKKRGLASPDHGDALCLTFAVKVPTFDAKNSRFRRRQRVANDIDYKIFG